MSRISTVRVLKSKNIPAIVIMVVSLAVLGSMALAAQDRFTLKAPYTSGCRNAATASMAG